jgi:hypothetical protein
MYNSRLPRVGQSILFFPNPDDSVALSNGKRPGDPVAAIVTQVWSSVCVNLKVVPDHGPMQDRGSVVHMTANPIGGYRWCFPEEYYTEEFEPTGTPHKTRLDRMAEYFSERIERIDREIEKAAREERGDNPKGNLVNLLEELKAEYKSDIAYLTSGNV